MTGDDLCIVVPLWRRTTNIARVFNSAEATTPDANVLFVVSTEDVEVRAALEAYCLNHILVAGSGGGTGDYAIKINEGYRFSGQPFIFTGADDVVFQPGWYAHARSVMDVLPFGVCGTVDDCNPRTEAGLHSTHSLVARWYADLGGCLDRRHVIYHERYEHEYCDDELVQTAMTRGLYVHSFGSHVTHLHPNVGAAPDDETYQRGRSRTRMSRALYRRRSRLWNPGGVQRG